MIALHGILLANREMEKVVSGEATVETRKFFYSNSSIVSLSHSLFIFVYMDPWIQQNLLYLRYSNIYALALQYFTLY